MLILSDFIRFSNSYLETMSPKEPAGDVYIYSNKLSRSAPLLAAIVLAFPILQRRRFLIADDKKNNPDLGRLPPKSRERRNLSKQVSLCWVSSP